MLAGRPFGPPIWRPAPGLNHSGDRPLSLLLKSPPPGAQRAGRSRTFQDWRGGLADLPRLTQRRGNALAVEFVERRLKPVRSVVDDQVGRRKLAAGNPAFNGPRIAIAITLTNGTVGTANHFSWRRDRHCVAPCRGQVVTRKLDKKRKQKLAGEG